MKKMASEFTKFGTILMLSISYIKWVRHQYMIQLGLTLWDREKANQRDCISMGTSDIVVYQAIGKIQWVVFVLSSSN